MKLQLFLLVCFLASIASAQLTFSGLPNVICGEENVTVTAVGVTTTTNIVVLTSVPSVGVVPSSFTLTQNSTESLSISCNAITPVQISFVDALTSVTYGAFYTYCKGVVYIQNPISSIIRGNDFSVTLFLFPTPTTVVDITVKVNNPIVVPGSDRLTFGVGQNTEDEVFYVPAGQVGPVNISFDSRSLRDYSGPNCQELVLSIDVLGTITSNLAAQTLAEGVYTQVTVQIQPPALDTVVVTIDALDVGTVVPQTLVFQQGQDTATFSILPNSLDATLPGTVNFTAEYYDTLVEYVYVIGTIFASVGSVIPTTSSENYYVVLLPGATTTAITVYLTASDNVAVPPYLIFPPGVSLVHFNFQALSEGPGFVTFSSYGYVTLTNNFIVQNLNCSQTDTFNINSTQCVACPIINGNICSNNGTCSFSTISQYLARCVCDSGFVGAYCELSAPSANAFQFTSSGGALSYYGIPGVLDTTFSVPPAIVQDGNPIGGGDGTVFVRGYNSSSPFPLAVDPSVVTPVVPNFNLLLEPPGFGIDITYSDNTIYNILSSPLTVTFYFDPFYISQTAFLELELFYFNYTTQQWVPALSTCSPGNQLLVENLIELTLETNLCVLGQYQFYSLVPIPAPQSSVPVYTTNNYQFGHQDQYQFPTTGGSGVQQPLPPQPHLAPVVVFDPSPPRPAVYEEAASSSLTPYFVIPIILVLSLLF